MANKSHEDPYTKHRSRFELVLKLNDRYSPDGSTSSISWESLQLHLETIFQVRPCETLTGYEVTEHGITARFITETTKRASK